MILSFTSVGLEGLWMFLWVENVALFNANSARVDSHYKCTELWQYNLMLDCKWYFRVGLEICYSFHRLSLFKVRIGERGHHYTWFCCWIMNDFLMSDYEWSSLVALWTIISCWIMNDHLLSDYERSSHVRLGIIIQHIIILYESAFW